MIRPTTPADVPTVLQLVRDLATYERDPDAVKATEATLHEALFGAKPVAEAVLAEIEGRAVGVALFFTNFSTWTGKPGIYLEDLFVREEARGSGAGTALLKHLAGIAVARGCTRFEWAVLDWNASAIGFYKSIGARAMDDWTIMRVEGEALARLAAD
jgi:GNAT superfamily N-acetyltransferase